MDKVETIAELYRRKFDWVPESIRNEIGHFNVFRLEPFTGDRAKPVPYQNRDYFKIMLVIGAGQVHYADRILTVDKQALAFSNPHIPYQWAHTDKITGGYFCIFDRHFFHQFGNLNQYSLFQPGGTHVFELSDEQTLAVRNLYERMFEEMDSDYRHKYDVLRNLVFELLHLAMKMQPPPAFNKQPANAAQRISAFFLELLERQFPIDETHPHIHLRSASDYAAQLSVHVNHLNRAVKETTRTTTSAIIAERILQEAKTLLRHGRWNISEIAYALGFKESTHFTNFFKKHTGLSPSQYRNAAV